MMFDDHEHTPLLFLVPAGHELTQASAVLIPLGHERKQT
jgi:hypothetical protein